MEINSQDEDGVGLWKARLCHLGSSPMSRGCYGSLIGLAGWRLRTGNVYDFYVLLEDGGLRDWGGGGGGLHIIHCRLLP